MYIITENLFSVILCTLVTQNYSSLLIKLFVGYWDTFVQANLKILIKQSRFMYSVGVWFNGPFQFAAFYQSHKIQCQLEIFMLCIHISSCDQIKFPQLVSVQLPGSVKMQGDRVHPGRAGQFLRQQRGLLCGSELCLSLHQVKIPLPDYHSRQNLCSSSRKIYVLSLKILLFLWLGFEHTKLFCRDKIVLCVIQKEKLRDALQGRRVSIPYMTLILHLIEKMYIHALFIH